MLLLSEGQAGEPWSIQTKNCCFGYRGAVNRTVLPVFAGLKALYPVLLVAVMSEMGAFNLTCIPFHALNS